MVKYLSKNLLKWRALETIKIELCIIIVENNVFMKNKNFAGWFGSVGFDSLLKVLNKQ